MRSQFEFMRLGGADDLAHTFPASASRIAYFSNRGSSSLQAYFPRCFQFLFSSSHSKLHSDIVGFPDLHLHAKSVCSFDLHEVIRTYLQGICSVMHRHLPTNSNGFNEKP